MQSDAMNNSSNKLIRFYFRPQLAQLTYGRSPLFQKLFLYLSLPLALVNLPLSAEPATESGKNYDNGRNESNVRHALKAPHPEDRATKLKYLNYEFARKYLKEVLQLYKEDRKIEMQKLLKLSTEYDGDETSDYWYLLASAHEEKWEKSRFEWLNKAFEIDQWFEFQPREPALALVHILYKWGLYNDIITWSQKWKAEITEDQDFQYYLTLAYNNSGHKEKAIELALNNLERYSYEERYFRVLLDAPHISKEMWVKFHFYLENYPPKSPNLLRYLVTRSTDISHMENLLSVYTSLFGDDYFTTAQRILMLQDNLIPRSNIFFDNYKTSDFLVLSQVIRRISGFRPIEKSLLDLNGLYVMDRNYDNIPEEELTFINGSLTERHVFPSKPNENDIRILWNSYGEPASYHSFYNHNGSSRNIDLTYGRYPFIREITITDRDSKRIYNFSPGRLTYDISRDVPLNTFDWAISPLQSPSLLESEIIQNSHVTKLYETQQRKSDWKLRAEYQRNYFGELTRIRIDRNLNGKFDEIAYLTRSQRVKILRDEDQDGQFELAIYYKKGVPKKYEVDINQDGSIDFTQTLGDISTKIWHIYGDLNLPTSSYKYAIPKTDYIYSYYFKWSDQTLDIFAPKYFESQN